MSKQRYTEEFKLAAVKQVTERHYPVAEVAEQNRAWREGRRLPAGEAFSAEPAASI